jgi:DNA-binding transcriptional LysR family regulator
VMELDNIETIKRTVEAGIGISLLPAPALAAEVRAGSIVERKLRESPIHRPIGVMFRKDRELSRGARAFVDLLTGELGALPRLDVMKRFASG